jgi:hypothetical protein
MDEPLFYEYMSQVFVPYVSLVREKIGKPAERAILLMDGMKGHCSERVLGYLREENIAAIIFPSHTTNLFQALDLCLFGVFKRRKDTTGGEFGDGSLKDQITKVLKAYEETATSFTIRGSFRRAGFKYIVTTKPYTLDFDESIVRENPGFKEIWDRNYSVEILRRRRCLSPFGLINFPQVPE